MSAKTKIEQAVKSMRLANGMVEDLRNLVKQAYMEGHAAGATRLAMGMNADKENAEFDWKKSISHSKVAQIRRRR